LSPRGIREMLGLNKPIYEKQQPMDILVESQRAMGHFLGKRPIKRVFF